jgi:hypothetical protein
MITEFFEKLYEAVRVNFTQEIENQRNSVVALQGKIISFYKHLNIFFFLSDSDFFMNYLQTNYM